MVAQLRATADSLGLPFGPRQMTYNTRLAQELGLWAEDQGFGDSFHHQAFLSYFRDGQNLASQQILLKLAEKIGLNPDKAREVLESRSYSTKVDGHWQEARIKGVRAVPTFICGEKSLVGAQSYSALKEFISSNQL